MRVVSLAFVDHGALLLVGKRGRWILPGGKIKAGETDIKALLRELKEELPESQLELGNFYKRFHGQTIRNEEVVCRVYFGILSGGLSTGAEVSGSLPHRYGEQLRLSSLTQMIVEALHCDGYL